MPKKDPLKAIKDKLPARDGGGDFAGPEDRCPFCNHNGVWVKTTQHGMVIVGGKRRGGQERVQIFCDNPECGRPRPDGVIWRQNRRVF